MPNRSGVILDKEVFFEDAEVLHAANLAIMIIGGPVSVMELRKSVIYFSLLDVLRKHFVLS